MWEEIPDSASKYVSSSRLEVHGGWVIRSLAESYNQTGGVAVHHVFLKDPDHIWSLEKEEEK